MPNDSHKLVFGNDPYTLNITPGTIIKHDHVVEEEPKRSLQGKEEPKYSDDAPKSIKDVLKDAGRQIVASLVILVVGFLLLNGSAYYQIAKNAWDTYTGTIVQEQAQLNKIADTATPRNLPGTILETSNNIDVQKKQIPDLNLDVVPTDNRIIIPRINQNIPIIGVSSKNLVNHDWSALEKDMQEALKDGVIHYPGTSVPGNHGNIVLTGHSSYFPWDPGRFKDVFALLHQMKIGDKIVIYYNQEKYVYEVKEKKVVKPTDINVLKQTPDDKLTLITCTPVGTNLNRLIVTAVPVVEGNVTETK
jgi:LPXTG-site transpeptidase (sortase) family protein